MAGLARLHDRPPAALKGRSPLDVALYLTASAVGLYMGAIALFVAVFWKGPRADLPTEQAGC